MTEDLSTDPTTDADGWGSFEMTWEFNIKNPSDWIGTSSYPVIKTTVEKNGLVVLELSSDVTCSDCRVYTLEENATT